MNNDFLPDFTQAFGILVLGTVLTFHVPTASAASSLAFQSSSLQVSEAIKTLDFSMPSYDKISNYKASISNVDGLAVEPLEQEEVKPEKVTKAKAPAKEGGSFASGFLPSMSKKGPMSVSANKPAKKMKVEAPRKSAAELIEEKKQEKITIVDLNLPSYQESTAAKEKSAFAF